MAKTVNEVLSEIRPEKGIARFSKKSFNELMKALANDTEYAAQVAVVKNKELADVKEIFVGKDFRKFLKRVLEKAGMDKADASVVLDPSFEIDNVDGLYEFISTAIYNYMDANNRFEFLPKEDFRGSMCLKEKAASTTTGRVHNPQTKEDLGVWERQTKAYRVLSCSSPAPDYLTTRRRISD